MKYHSPSPDLPTYLKNNLERKNTLVRHQNQNSKNEVKAAVTHTSLNDLIVRHMTAKDNK